MNGILKTFKIIESLLLQHGIDTILNCFYGTRVYTMPESFILWIYLYQNLWIPATYFILHELAICQIGMLLIDQLNKLIIL